MGTVFVGGSLVLERGLSCSDKDGFVVLGVSGLEEQEMVNFLICFCFSGLVKKMGLLVSDCCFVRQASIGVGREEEAMGETERKAKVLG